MRVWAFDLKNINVKMADAEFKNNKLGYLIKKYPLGDLSAEGCIATADGDGIHYRRVDPFRGLIADLVYMKHLGRDLLTISADDYSAKCHKIRASVIYPQVANYYDDPIIANPTFARAVLKELKYRMERRYDNHAGTRINNDWFETLNTPRRAQRAYDRLKVIVDARKS